jgi:hypothetical protein
LLSLIGATLVLWGSRTAVLRIPGPGDVNLLDVSNPATWTLSVAAAATMIFLWVPPRIAAWISFVVAVGAIAFLCHELYHLVNFAKTAGQSFANLVDTAVSHAEIKPGAVAIGSGILILALALIMRTPAKRHSV